MLIVERQEKLLAMLRERKTAQLDDLARALEVSPSTVRRDLEALEQQGMVRRTHGGAVFQPPATESAAGSTSPTTTLATRMTEQVEAKQAIARAAAALVQPHMTVLFDGGSTVVMAAREIKARPLQVVTNSLLIANHFADEDQVELLLIGGTLYPRTGVTVGTIALNSLANLHADLFFFSLAGIDDDAGYNINMAMVQVEQAMMKQTQRSVMLMDSSKFGRKSLVRVCGLDDVHRIITDPGIEPAWQERLGDRLQLGRG